MKLLLFFVSNYIMKLLIVEDEPNLLAILRKDSQSQTTK
jgi:hypothetical protein